MSCSRGRAVYGEPSQHLSPSGIYSSHNLYTCPQSSQMIVLTMSEFSLSSVCSLPL